MADGLTREFWSNAGRVRYIFKVAFEAAGLSTFTPHSFRHMLAHPAGFEPATSAFGGRECYPNQLKMLSFSQIYLM